MGWFLGFSGSRYYQCRPFTQGLPHPTHPVWLGLCLLPNAGKAGPGEEGAI